MRKELIRQDRSTFSGEDSFRFRHLLVRDAAYNGIAKQQRSDLHERFARWLVGVAGDRVSEYEEILAYHYEQAWRNLSEVGILDERTLGLSIEAGTRLAAAGRRAAARGDAPATVTLLRRATDALPRTHPTRLAILPELVTALIDEGDLQKADATIRETRAVAEEADNEALAWQAKVLAAGMDIFRGISGATARARDVSSQAIEAFERLNDHRGLARSWQLLSIVVWMAQRASETAQALERAMEHWRLAGDPTNELNAVRELTMTLYFGPIPWPEAVERTGELRREYPSRWMDSAHVAIQARAAMAEGRFDEGRAGMDEAVAILADLGVRIWVAGFTQGRARAELYTGDRETAARILREGADAFEEMGERAFRSTNVGELAGVLVDLGRYEEAERFARDARDTGDELDKSTQVCWRVAMSKLAAHRGDGTEALRLIREALAMLEESDFIEYRAGALVDAAVVYRATGREADADASLARAEELYAAKGVPVMVERVRAMRVAGSS